MPQCRACRCAVFLSMLFAPNLYEAQESDQNLMIDMKKRLESSHKQITQLKAALSQAEDMKNLLESSHKQIAQLKAALSQAAERQDRMPQTELGEEAATFDWSQCTSEGGAKDCARCDNSGGVLPCSLFKSKSDNAHNAALNCKDSELLKTLTFFVPPDASVPGGDIESLCKGFDSKMAAAGYVQTASEFPTLGNTSVVMSKARVAFAGGQVVRNNVVVLMFKRVVLHMKQDSTKKKMGDVFKEGFCIRCDRGWKNTFSDLKNVFPDLHVTRSAILEKHRISAVHECLQDVLNPETGMLKKENQCKETDKKFADAEILAF